MTSASELGRLIRQARLRRGLSLRAFARQVGKSPAYIVALERAPSTPGVSEETLLAIADRLHLEPDRLLATAAKFPATTIPRSPTEIALYRLIKKLSTERQEELRRQLEAETTELPVGGDESEHEHDRGEPDA